LRRRIAPPNCAAELRRIARVARLGSQGRGVGDGAAPEDEPDELDEGGGEGEPEHPRVHAHEVRHRREQRRREVDAVAVERDEGGAARRDEQRADAEDEAGLPALRD